MYNIKLKRFVLKCFLYIPKTKKWLKSVHYGNKIGEINKYVNKQEKKINIIIIEVIMFN